MKERIKDIALDCMVKYVNDGDGWGFSTEELEKFAKAIVNECADRIDASADTQVFTDPTFNKGYFFGRSDAAMLLRDLL